MLLKSLGMALYFMVSFLSSLGVVLFSKKSRLFVDNANKPQGFHTQRTARAGGLGIFLVSILAFLDAHGGVIWGLILVFLSGFLEDLNFSLSPKTRLLLQALGGGLGAFF